MKQPVTAEPSIRLSSVAPLRRTPSAPTSESTQLPARLSKPRPIPLTDTPKRLLGLDIENGTRWGWGPHGYTHSIIYCVTTKLVGSADDDVRTFWIDWRQPDQTIRAHLAPMFQEIAGADCFLGHNFSHDFKGISGLARDLQLSFPEKKPVIDTYKDLVPHDGASKSLEDLCLQLGLGDKPHLPQRDWVDAFIRAKPDAIQKVIDRNRADVILTERLYEKERELGWLKTSTYRKAA